MSCRPVFQDKFEASTWKKLTSKPGSSKRAEFYSGIANNVLKYEGTINSAILTELIRSLNESQVNDFQQVTDKLLIKCRPNDCSPLLTAAVIHADAGRLEKAEEIVKRVRPGQNIPFLSCVKAKIYMKMGDLITAKKELMKARCSDPAYPMFYELIQQIEPTEGWMHRRNIELLNLGKEPILCGDSDASPAETLFSIYNDWYKGNKDRATERIIGSEEYKKKNPEYMLASARMSMDERDWHSAQRVYQSLLTKSTNCSYIICEAAKSFYFGSNYDQALILYRDAEALNPSSPMVLRGLIQTYSALGMKGEASQCIQVFLNTENAHLDSFIAGARLLMENSMFSDAASILNRILITYPDDVDVLILKSEVELRGGNANAAMITALNGIDKNPDNADIRLQKARIFHETGKTDKAVKELVKARSIDPNNIGVLALLMDIAFSVNNSVETKKLGNKILELDPGNIHAMNMVSKASLSGKEDGESYAVYKDMVLSDNRVENLINVLQSLISDGRYSDAVRLCEERERDFGKVAMVKRLKGNAEYALGEFSKASASFADASSYEPLDSAIWHSKGMADEAKGDLDHAEEAYNRAILLNMDEPEFWISRSSIQEKKGDLDGAVESLNKAIGLKPDFVYALVRKGMIFSSVGKFDESVYFFNMALMIDPTNIRVLKMQRDVYFASNNVARAEECALAVVDMGPQDPEAVEAAARILHSAGKKAEATALIENALRKNPKSLPMLFVKKEFHTFSESHREVIQACEAILNIQPDNNLVRSDLAEAYASFGDTDSANRLYLELRGKDIDPEIPKANMQDTKKEYKQNVPDTVKRYSERVLRRAYISKFTLSDPDLVEALDMDENTVEAVMTYLADIKEYGDITPGTPEFDRMEQLSMNAVSKGGYDNLDEDPVISIPCAYVAGGAKDADEAKTLVAYIYKALTSKPGSKAMTPELRKMALGISKEASTSDIVKKLKIGVYQAHVIKKNL